VSRLFVAEARREPGEYGRLAADPAASDTVAILGAAHRQSRPIEGLSTIVSSEKQSHGLVVANLGHADPDRTKAAIGLAGHGDARAMTVAGLDRNAPSVPQIATSAAIGAGHPADPVSHVLSALSGTRFVR
jgi:hypothetical protein